MMTSIDDPDATVDARSDMESVSHDMYRSQRALELRKFFAPFDPVAHEEDTSDYNARLNDDGALDSYAENVLWRLGGVRCMISLIDRETQYFLAGAIRRGSRDDPEMSAEGSWFGCQTVETPGGLCENTMALNDRDDYPCYVVKDLAADKRFADLPVVNGQVASYRFYAGTPIITDLNVRIGSFFVFDDQPRPGGLRLDHRRYLWTVACNVMKHLETRREAAERKRIALMSKGIAKFLETTAKASEDERTKQTDAADQVDPGEFSPDPTMQKSSTVEDDDQEKSSTKTIDDKDPGGCSQDTTNPTEETASEQTLDKIKMTLDQAADILRESLELNVGGVVFLDMPYGYNQPTTINAFSDSKTDLGAEVADQFERMEGDSEKAVEKTQTQKANKSTADHPGRKGSSPGLVRGTSHHANPAKVLAMSAARVAQWEEDTEVLDGKTLQTFINTYPQGNVWYIDDEGYFSSLDQANEAAKTASDTKGVSSSNSRSITTRDTMRQQAEASLLTKIFKGTRQVIFIPLWDGGGDRWHCGCFVWSRSAVPVFTVDSEISYLSAFTNSLMVEISRLDAITANKMKSDFISSISHEFRSPLHGILASADFLRESELEPTQTEFVATIQTCGSTLLDTINHVLDYSKINSFEKSSDKGAIFNELHQTSNIALLCEEIVSGMVAANEYQNTQLAGKSITGDVTKVNGKRSHNFKMPQRPVEVILDFEFRDWNFWIQPGALRRIMMNIFGNAQKYTSSGFILVRLRVRHLEAPKPSSKKRSESPKPEQKVLALNIIDSGRGMSNDYMERKLYTPFAQEDTFASGVGLGLSIVHSIVTQLEGQIQVHSEKGKGTDVEITIPLHDEGEADQDPTQAELAEGTTGSQEAEHNLTSVRRLAAEKTVAIWHEPFQDSHTDRSKSMVWNLLEKYCSQWFGFNVVSTNDSKDISTADLVITEKRALASQQSTTLPSNIRGKLLLIWDESSWLDKKLKANQMQDDIGNIWVPAGPFKLARSILSLFRSDVPRQVQSVSRPGLTSSSKSDSDSQISTTCTSNFSAASETGNKQEELTRTCGDDSANLDNLNNDANAKSDVAQADQTTISSLSNQSQALPMIESLSLGPASPSSKVLKASSLVSPLKRPLCLLAVDDNDVNLQLISRYLKKRKLDTVHLAKDGLAALNAVKSMSKSVNENGAYDIIFMDISMPVMDGFDSTAAIRLFEHELGSELRQRTYVVALTGLGSKRDRDRAVECGFDDFLTKPVNFKKVGDLIERISTTAKEEENANNGETVSKSETT